MADDKSTNPVYAILDVETTGLSRKRDRIIQIACLKIGKDDTQKTWMRYINPEMDTEYLKRAFPIHHISPEFLQEKPLFKDVAESFCDFLKDVDYLVAHNCMFDWDMLSREFEILGQNQKKDENSREDISKLWWEKFHYDSKWVDTLRLAMICFPKRDTYRLQAIKNFLNIEPQQGIDGEGLSQCDYGGDEWKQQQHDAMYDVFTTYGILQHCIKSTFYDLLQNYPMALLDTNLLLDMQRLIDENRTRSEDLLPFAQRSKEYFTTSRPKGKKLGELSKYFLQMLTVSLKVDSRSDDRVILIYDAAILEPLKNEMVSHSSASMKENVEKEEKVEDKKEENEKKEGKVEKMENKKDEYVEKEEKMEDKKEEEVKHEVEIANKMKEEQEKRNGNAEENLNCSSQKRPRLNLQ